MESLSVKEIRDNNVKITKKPIVYYWWFKKISLDTLLSKLESEIEFEKIKIKEVNGEKYGLLYIGRTVNGHNRLVKYHIFDSSNFHEKGVENKRLSSLRQTLCGLLDFPMSKSKNDVNDFMDENSFIEWKQCASDKLNSLEKTKIKENYLPLNSQNTKGTLTTEHRKILRESKNRMRK